MKKLLLVLLLLAACAAVNPVPTPPPADCDGACHNLRDVLHCPGAQPVALPDGGVASCEDVCRANTDLNTSCAAAAKSCSVADDCQD